MKRLAPACAVAACLAIAVSAGAQSADPAMDKLARDYEKAWAAGDASAVTALYTDDVLVVNAEGVHQGRAALLKSMTTSFAGPWKGTQIVVHEGTTKAVGPDTALNEGTYEITGVKGPDGKPVAIKGSYLNTVVKKGGAWRIAGNMAFAPPPGATPAAK